MNSQKVISDIHKIYQQFIVPPFIQEHMMRTAAVGLLITQHWSGPTIDTHNIQAALLIHDLANIIKSDLQSEIGQKIMGNQAERLEYWLEVKKQIISKYGDDEHIAESKMLEELNIEPRLLEILENMSIGYNNQNLESYDWDIKICAYADQRIGPFGVLSLKKRYDDLTKRKNRHVEKPGIIGSAFKIEEQIMSNTELNFNPESINDESILEYVNHYKTPIK